jgi:hypothetical protein
MKNFQIIILIILGWMTNACNQNQEATPQPTDEQQNSQVMYVKNAELTQQAFEKRGSEENSDPFEIIEVYKGADNLKVKVRYSGGCKEHHFQAVWNGVMLFTEPPLIHLILLHKANDDNCEALVEEIITIDYQKLIGEDFSGNVVVNVSNGSSQQDVNWQESETIHNCSVVGTVKDYIGLDGCHWVIVLEDGSKLEVAENLVPSFQLKDNQKVKLGYSIVDGVSICMVGKLARIECIEEME